MSNVGVFFFSLFHSLWEGESERGKQSRATRARTPVSPRIAEEQKSPFLRLIRGWNVDFCSFSLRCWCFYPR